MVVLGSLVDCGLPLGVVVGGKIAVVLSSSRTVSASYQNMNL